MAAAAVTISTINVGNIAPGIAGAGAGPCRVSHSASVRSRYSFPVNCESQATYCFASYQVTLITGICPRPQPSATPGQADAATQASHSANVTSHFETANGSAPVTSCCGPSPASRSGSFCGDPIMNLPGGMTIITGQPVAHSLKTDPGLAAFDASLAAESTSASWPIAREAKSICARQKKTAKQTVSTLRRRSHSADATSANRSGCLVGGLGDGRCAGTRRFRLEIDDQAAATQSKSNH
jgi:hypothetical protein